MIDVASQTLNLLQTIHSKKNNLASLQLLQLIQSQLLRAYLPTILYEIRHNFRYYKMKNGVLWPEAFSFECFYNSSYCQYHCCASHVDFVFFGQSKCVSESSS